jgi:Zn-dependent protease with chaperone function
MVKNVFKSLLENPHAKVIEKYLKRETKAQLLNESQHRAFLKPVYEIADSLGIKTKPTIFVVEHMPSEPKAYKHIPNAGASARSNTIIVNEAFLKLSKSNVNKPMNTSMRGVIAHELSHVRYDRLNGRLRYHAPFIGVVTGIIGMYFYNKRNERKQSDAKKNENQQALHREYNQDHETSHSEDNNITTPQETPVWKQKAATIARYAWAAGAGCITVMALMRPIALRNEYRADRIGVKFSGDANAYKKVLTDLQQEGIKQAKKLPPIETKEDFIKEIKSTMRGLTTHAHPSMKNRLKAIDSYAKKLAQERSGASDTKGIV